MYRLLIFICLLASCKPKTPPAPITYLDQYFELNEGQKDGAPYYYLNLNTASIDTLPHHDFIQNNRKVMSYLMWNLVSVEMPDSIRYASNKNHSTVQNDFSEFLIEHEAIQSTFHQLFDGGAQNSIPIDSLVRISEKLHFAQNAGENKIGWTICVGKSILPDIYGRKRHIQSILYQAYCLQAVFEAETAGDSTLDEVFMASIHRVTPLLKELDSGNEIAYANKKMWEFLDWSPTYRNAITHYFQRKEDLPFKIE